MIYLWIVNTNEEEIIMDYRYETKNEVRDFHKQRKAFLILNDELEFLPEGRFQSR